jgi:hypothetical protein
VHATFGRTLITAGITRIIEICVFAPGVALPLPEAGGAGDSDSHSEHTLADAPAVPGAPPNPKVAAATAFRHLPPLLMVASGYALLAGAQKARF